MKQIVMTAIVALALCAPALAQGGGKIALNQSLEGTSWEGVVRAPNSDGTFTDYQYVFNFLSGGRVSWHWSGSVYTNGIWKQTGTSIRMELNDGYSAWTGTIKGARMSGTAINKLGHKWDWALSLKPGNPHGKH